MHKCKCCGNGNAKNSNDQQHSLRMESAKHEEVKRLEHFVFVELTLPLPFAISFHSVPFHSIPFRSKFKEKARGNPFEYAHYTFTSSVYCVPRMHEAFC